MVTATATDWDVRILDDLTEIVWLEKTVRFLQSCLPPKVPPPVVGPSLAAARDSSASIPRPTAEGEGRLPEIQHAGSPPASRQVGGWSVESLRWKLGAANPAGSGFLSCAVVGEDLVGVTSITCKRLWVQQRMVIGGEIGDTYTHPVWLRQRPSAPKADYVSHSIFGRLVTETKARALARGITLIYGTPNANSQAGYQKRLHFTVHPFQNRAFVRPTPRSVVARSRWARRFGGPLAAGLRFGDAALQGAWSALRRIYGYTVEPMPEASEELDDLWDLVKGACAFSLVRDRAYFQHRFFNHPLAAYQVYRLMRRQRLCGVIVTRIMMMPWGKRYDCLADWCVDPSQPQGVPVLLAEAIRRQDRTGLDGYYLWGGQARLQTALRLLGFVPVGCSPIIFFNNTEGQALMAECRELDFTLAASDSV